jgi:hypothetical protein
LGAHRFLSRSWTPIVAETTTTPGSNLGQQPNIPRVEVGYRLLFPESPPHPCQLWSWAHQEQQTTDQLKNYSGTGPDSRTGSATRRLWATAESEAETTATPTG